MSHDPQQSPSNSGANTWTDPPWTGFIETTGDALLILEAARRGMIPRVTRRLVDAERKMITSGSVFVFDEDESGIKRWTDGFFWSPSRILGNFLLYRETEKRGAGHRSARSEQNQEDMDGPKGVEGQSLSRPKSETHRLAGVDRQRERSLVGSLTNSYKFKPDGMMKKTFSLTIGGVAQHLISYYKIEDVAHGRLRSPSSLPEIAALEISPEYLDKTHFRNPPKVELGHDGILRYRGEADDVDASPPLLPAPLTGAPVYTEGGEGSSKRSKQQRYGPYDGSSSNKRRKKGSTSSSNPTSSPIEPTSPTVVQPTPQAAAYTVAESTAVQPVTHYAQYGYYPVTPGYAPAPVYPPSSPYPTLPPPTTGSPQPPTPPNANPQYSYAGFPPPDPSGVYSPYYPPHSYTPYSPWSHYGYAPQVAHGPTAIEGQGARVEEVSGEAES